MISHIVGHIKFELGGLNLVLNHPFFVHLEDEFSCTLRHLVILSVTLPVFGEMVVVRASDQLTIGYGIGPSGSFNLESPKAITVVTDSVRVHVGFNDSHLVNKFIRDDGLSVTGGTSEEQ